MAEPKLNFQHLTVSERIQLVEDLWDSIADAPEVLDLTDARRAELDRRLEAYRKNPDEVIPWEALRRELYSTATDSGATLLPTGGPARHSRDPKMV